MSNMQHAEETALTADQKPSVGVRGKVPEAKEADEKGVKRPASIVVGVILTCIMPAFYLVGTLIYSPSASIHIFALYIVPIMASICVFRRKANARFVVLIMYLIYLFGGSLSFLFLTPFVIPLIGLMLMFSPSANKWLRRR